MEKVAIIMAGGAGNRFWPLSRINRPKQLIQFEDNSLTLLEEAIERAKSFLKIENIFIITNQYLIEPISNLLKELPAENIIAEPLKRNTAPCLALASAIISARMAAKGIAPENILVSVLTADQRIFPIEAFTKTVETLLRFIEFNDALATIGVKPERPETGYGYIEVEEEFDNISSNIQIKPLKTFHEKPSSEKALMYFSSSRYLWNSGMFFWRLDVFNSNMIKYYPIIGEKIAAMHNVLSANNYDPDLTRNNDILSIYSSFPDISIDYALMEKANKIIVARAVFSWEDLGSFDTLPRIFRVDNKQNYSRGQVSLIEVENSIIINASEKSDMIVTALGVSDIVIAATDDAVMICPKGRVQEVKRIVDKVKEKNGEKWL
jgi:mannose-1-phosphate guanylyltransferase